MILFVDDDVLILEGIRRMLRPQREEWDMHFVLGAEAALEQCSVYPFDAVVSDMRMPGMDGATLLHHVKERLPGAARLILSGYSDASHVARAVVVAHRILAKPCSVEELRRNIEQACKSAVYEGFTEL